MKTAIVEISCVEVWGEISKYVDDEVSPELKARIDLHLKNCKHCQAVLDGTRNTVRLIADGEWYPLPSGFSGRLFQRLSVECFKNES